VASRVLRWSLIATGSAVWLWQLYEWYDPDGADELLFEDGIEYDKEARRFYAVSEAHSDSGRAELESKDKALFALLKKLESQPELPSALGAEHLALWPGSYGMRGGPLAASRDEQSRAWTPSFFLNGPNGTCVVDVVLEKNRLAEWVPTSISVEELQRSGNVLLRAEAELPHGLAYLNRLSSASVDPVDARSSARPKDPDL
jgi:hypothetical protein